MAADERNNPPMTRTTARVAHRCHIALRAAPSSAGGSAEDNVLVDMRLLHPNGTACNRAIAPVVAHSAAWDIVRTADPPTALEEPLYCRRPITPKKTPSVARKTSIPVSEALPMANGSGMEDTHSDRPGAKKTMSSSGKRSKVHSLS